MSGALKKRCSGTMILFFATLFCFSQYKVTFVVTALPSYHNMADPVYLAGSFNNWNPHNERFRLIPNGGKYGITIELNRGMFEFKLTKGNWETVESAESGITTANRTVDVEKDTTINVEIKNWADHFPKTAKPSTSGRNVHILDSSFYIPQLNRHRRIWIYLPASYSTTYKKYPVLYMQDGQNVFDAATSYSGEWGVDETLDKLGEEYGESIVVAIDNGGDKRMNEYSPVDMPQYGKGEGDAYVDFLVQTLMPYINHHYRTKRHAKYNFIAGSSMGGLISFYAMLKYPEKFGGAGVFSPAFWIAPKIKDLTNEKAHMLKGKIYFYAGELEGESMVPDMLAVFNKVKNNSKAVMEAVIRAEGKHNEDRWRQEFPGFYKWLMKKI
ncbi:MAG: alpha/beta hydrolase-fold protein [Candidatus Dadabacteria bacterium]